MESHSPDLNPIEHEFHQLKRRVKAETPQNKRQLELAALKAGKSIFKDETQESGDVYGSQTHCCDCAQGICN